MQSRGLKALSKAVRSGSSQERLEAVWCLGELFPGEARCLPVLESALSDPDADVRGTAAEALGKLGAQLAEAVAVLVRAAEVEEATDFRARVVYAFGRCGPAAAPAVPCLVDMVRGRDGHASWAALWSLGEIGPRRPEVLSTLQFGLESTAAANRFVAAWALGHAGEPARPAAAGLRNIAADVHPLVRETAHWALGEILGEAEAFPAERPAAQAGSAELASLAHELSDSRRPVRLAAAWRAGELGPPGAALAPELRQILSETDPELQGAAAESLGKVGHGSPEVAMLLADRLADGACPVRAQIAYALGWMGEAAHGAVGKILSFFHASAGVSHRQIEARWAAACTLGLLRFRDPGLVGELIAMLGDPESDVRFMAAESLGYLGHTAVGAVPALRAAAADLHWTVRSRAAWALARVGG
jgi:HEAT repeat protein